MAPHDTLAVGLVRAGLTVGVAVGTDDEYFNDVHCDSGVIGVDEVEVSDTGGCCCCVWDTVTVACSFGSCVSIPSRSVARGTEVVLCCCCVGISDGELGGAPDDVSVAA